MAQSLTKAHLTSLHDAIRAELRQNTKDIIGDQRDSLRPVRKDLETLKRDSREANTKLDAIMSGEVLVTREQIVRLLDTLKAQGFRVDEREIFAS